MVHIKPLGEDGLMHVERVWCGRLTQCTRRGVRCRVKGSEWDQIVLFTCLALYHTKPDFGERQYRSRTRKKRFDPSARAEAHASPLPSEKGTTQNISRIFCLKGGPSHCQNLGLTDLPVPLSLDSGHPPDVPRGDLSHRKCF